MNVKDLKSGQGKVDVQLLIKSVSEVRSFNKYGKELKVANAVGSDDSGEIKISLWNDDITKVNTGDTIKITNGYVSEFNGEKQLSAGKFGKIETVTSANGSAPVSSAVAKPVKAVASVTKAPAVVKKPVKKEAFDEEKEEALEADEEKEEDFNYEEKEF